METSKVRPDVRRELTEKKAYELYVQRGGEPGRELEDWLTAEKIVEGELEKTSASSRMKPAAEQQIPHITPIRRTSPKMGGGSQRLSG